MAGRKVGFIGLGQMGFGMASNILAAGHEVLAYDMRPEPMQRLAAKGGRRANGPAAIGAECDTAIVIVANGKQVDDVVCGPDGLARSMRGGTVIVSSTILLTEFLEVVEKAKALGVTVLDCPVSGGEEGANAGTLTVLCGGDEARIEALRPILASFGRQVEHLGPVGSGLVGKLANNLVGGITRIAIAEAFAMAKKAGVPVDKLYKAMTLSSGDSRTLRSLEGQLLRNAYPDMTLHAIKDLTAALDSAQSVGQSMPLTSLSREIYQLADEKLGGMRGSTHVLRFFIPSS